MNLNEENIGAYIIDWNDGKLDRAGQEAVRNFLAQHPSLGIHPGEQLPELFTPIKINLGGKEMLHDAHMPPLKTPVKPTNKTPEKPKIDKKEEAKATLAGEKTTFNTQEGNEENSTEDRIRKVASWVLLILLLFVIIYFAKDIAAWFQRSNRLPDAKYKPRTELPVQFEEEALEAERKTSMESSVFSNLVLESEYEQLADNGMYIPKKINLAKRSPKKTDVVRRSPVVTSQKKKTTSQARYKPRAVQPEVFEDLEPMETKGYDYQPIVLNPEFLPASEPIDTAFLTPLEQKEIYPPNKGLRNNLLQAADEIGGKKIKYVRRKDGSFKFIMDFSFLKVERTIDE